MAEYEPKCYCPRCGYRMSPGRCPECGFDVSAEALAKIHPARRKRRRLIIGAAVIIPVGVLVSPYVFLLGIIAVDDMKEYLNRLDFNSAAWQDPARVQKNVRIRMVDDLLAKHKLRGMAKQEVADILGESDDTTYFSNWDMVYWLGPERGFAPIDSEWLVINLDDTGRVSEYRLVTD